MKEHVNQKWIKIVLGKKTNGVYLLGHAFYCPEDPSVYLRAHEYVHHVRARSTGSVKWYLGYFKNHFKYGYWNNPEEIVARRLAKKFEKNFNRSKYTDLMVYLSERHDVIINESADSL